MRTSSPLVSGTNLTKLQKHIDNTNRQIMKSYQHHHSAIMKTQAVLGISNPSQHQQIPYKLLVSLNQQQLLYYSCKYFIIYNITSKEYQIINKDVKNCTLKKLRRFNTIDSQRKLIVGIYQSNQTLENTFIGLLTIKTDYESRTSRGEGRYEWKVVRLVTQQVVAVQNFTYYPKKNYLYIVVNKQSTETKYVIASTSSTNQTTNNSLSYNNISNTQQLGKNTQQFLYVYDLTKQILLVNQQIKSNTVGFYVQFVAVEDYNAVYLTGKNYFRLWSVNFNEKSIKESNVRNIERLLKNKTIVDLQEIQRYSMKLELDHHSQQIPFLNPHLQLSSPILTTPSKLLIILTRQQILLIKSNQLICFFTPQQNISLQSKTKQNIQRQLQNSFNQIHKMKFLFDEYQQMKDKEDYYQAQRRGKVLGANGVDAIKQDEFYFTAISKYWRTQNNILYIAIANSKCSLLLYQIVDYQLKLYTQFDCSVSGNRGELKRIVPVQSGDVLLCTNEMNQVHLVNQESTYQENEPQIKSLWGNAHLHNGQIYSMSSPRIQNIMCTVGQDCTFKLWSMRKNQRTILFQSKPSGSRPIGITMHPGGTIVCVNFQRQIKLYTILPHQFYQITNIKTNYCPLQLRYSYNGEFLVSNEGSVLIFYQSFSLKKLGYIEPADIQFKIVDFRVSRNASHICFITEDNSCFIHPIDVGDLSQWKHFSPSHRQGERYTAFEFDFIEKDKGQANISNEQRKVRSLFIGATRNKYMVLYENLGEKLLMEFPVVDCYIVGMEISESLMFAATSKGTIRVYNWPILQQQLQLQIISVQSNQIRYKPPRFQQYQIWHQSIPITSIHKLNFSSQLIITNPQGNMSIISYQQTKNKKIIYEQVQPQRKKMQQLINQMFYIKKSQIQKRNKLIQKTQNDILKVQNEILRQKISLQRKMRDEEGSVRKGFEMKTEMQYGQKIQYITKQQQQTVQLRRQIVAKKQQLQRLKQTITRTNQDKKLYQQWRNQQVTEEIRQIVLRHKERIKKKIQAHKEEIRNKKKEYLIKVKTIQEQFNKEVIEVYQERLREISGADGQGVANNNTITHGGGGGDLLVNLLCHDNAIITTSSHDGNDGYDILDSSIKNLVDKLDDIQMCRSGGMINSIYTNTNYGNNNSMKNSVNVGSSGNNNIGGNIHGNVNSGSTNKNNFVGSNGKSPSIMMTAQQSKAIQNVINSPQQNSMKMIGIEQKQQQLPQPSHPTKLLKRSSTAYHLCQKSFLRRKQQQAHNYQTTQQHCNILTSHMLMQKQFNNQILQQMTSKQNEDILIQSSRVGELQRGNMQLERQILGLKMKVMEMQKEDQLMQKEFQAHLEEYNLARFSNLNLHCEVLKMQNQLVQRRQVLDNKQQIVMLAYQQKQKLQNYKQLVCGSLTKMQQRKQTLRQLFFKKQTDLNLIFGQLVNEINKLEQKKHMLERLERKRRDKEKQYIKKQCEWNQVISKLKDVKKHLLLEKRNDQGRQRSIYVHEEALIQTINFLKKRLFMQSMKQKKNKQLKKSMLNQVLKQNKNLLQECNQLRSQGIQYQIQIKNLSNKLKDANKMIAIQSKLNSQKHNVKHQKSQLEIMQKLFKIQMEEFDEKIQGDQRSNGNNSDGEDQQLIEQEEEVRVSRDKQVHFDAEQEWRRSEYEGNATIQRDSNLMGKSLPVVRRDNYTAQSRQDYNQHKPFKLSKSIAAESYEKL